MKYFKDVKCLRIESNKLKISWRDENIDSVKLYLVHDKSESFICTIVGNNEIIVDDLQDNKRSIFLIKSDGYHSEYIAEKIIPFNGVHHFRDIGGYKSSDGRRVKWNTFFRSDKLSGLTSDDINYFKSLGIKTILDLRSLSEVKAHPDPKIDGVEYINISGIPDFDEIKDNFDMMYIFKQRVDGSFNPMDFLIKGYKSLVFDNPAYKELVDCMENEERLPIVFHCTAGKDRTGFATAIILSILGVSEEIIMEDYLLSNVYRKPINEKIIEAIKGKIKDKKSLDILNLMLDVRAELLQSSFDSIKEKYGTMEIYLEKEYGLTKKKRKELKSRFLY